MFDPFDPVYHQPPVRPLRKISITFGSDRQAEEMAEFNASLDALLAEVDVAPAVIETTTEDDDIEAAVAAAEVSFTRTREPASPETGIESAPARSLATKPEEFPELSGNQGSIVMPYGNHYATRILSQQKPLFRAISSRSVWLTDTRGNPASVGTGSILPLFKATGEDGEEKEVKAIRKFRNQFPTWFTEEPTPSNSLVVRPRRPASLPRWKDKPGASKATSEDREFLLATQFAALAVRGEPIAADLDTQVNDPTVGFFSMTLPTHLHEKVLGPKPANLFHKDLMRRVQSLTSDPAGVFAWRRETSNSITLFGMLADCGDGSAPMAAKAAAGRRFGLALLKAGLTPMSFNSVSDEKWAELFDLDEDVFFRGWANGNDELMRQQAPDMHVAIEFDFSMKRFLSAGEIAEKDWRHEAIWNDYALRCGIPIWLGGKMLDVFLDVLVRTEELAKKRRHTVAAAEKPKGLRAVRARARAALAVMDAALPDELETLRFYRGSPAQFAATVMSQGTLLGTYCGAEVNTHSKHLYEAIRDAEASK